jgi:tetratricopeptide (TPR) repeat protein
MPELRAAMEAGPPPGAAPTPVAAVVPRALAAKPDARYPDMAALLADLSRATAPGRRRQALVVAGALGIAGALVFAGARRHAAPDPCGGGDARAASVWNVSKKEQLSRALGAADTTAAGAIAARAASGLDGYADAWKAAYRATCEAGLVRHEQSQEVLDARMHCLDVRLDALGAIAGTLTLTGGDTAAQASEAVAQLPAIADCADTVSLAAMDPRPRAPDVVARLDGLERRLSEARATGLAGRYDDARAALVPLAADARAIGYRPAIAEADLLGADLARRTGAYADAEKHADDALMAAEAARDDRRAARAWLEMVAIASERGAHAEVLSLARHAEAALARIGSPALLVATLRHQRCVALTAAGALADARVELEAALDLRKRELGEAHFEVARTWSALANLARAKGDLEEALTLHRRALAIDVRALGEGHPATARHYHNVGGVLRLLGRLAEALASYEHVLSLESRGSGARHPATALTHNSIAILHLEANEPAAARTELEIAMGILEPLGHPDRGLVLHNLGLAAQLEGKHREALARFDAALAVLKAAFGEEHERVAALLASRAKSLRALGDEARAEAAAKRALAIVAASPPTSPEAQRVRADAAAAVRKAPPPRAPRPPSGGAYGPAQTWDSEP